MQLATRWVLQCDPDVIKFAAVGQRTSPISGPGSEIAGIAYQGAKGTGGGAAELGRAAREGGAEQSSRSWRRRGVFKSASAERLLPSRHGRCRSYWQVQHLCDLCVVSKRKFAISITLSFEALCLVHLRMSFTHYKFSASSIIAPTLLLNPVRFPGVSPSVRTSEAS